MNLHNFINDLNKKTPFSGFIGFNEPMANHTSYRTGGPADLLVRPDKDVFPAWTPAMLRAAKAEDIPVFVLGGGANILVSDKGIRGIVLDTGSWEGVEEPLLPGNPAPAAGHGSSNQGGLLVKVLSGTLVDTLTENLAGRGLSGMEFLAGMPGTVGGAVWMNARCYGKSVSDQLALVEILDENLETVPVPFCERDFSYKKSPFQNRNILILSAVFRVFPRDASDILKTMAEHRQDREEKGHYRFPSAGSVFKNNHAFGEPSGKIIADLGLKGLGIGGAQIASWHGNLIVNKGNASSMDIRLLMDEVVKRVKEEKGLSLENEVLLIGDW